MIITICLVIFGIIGTTMMTIFSFIYSYITNYSFNEPNLLNYVLVTSEFLFLRRLGEQQIIGWIFHYLIGIAFAYLYYKGIDIYDFDSTLPNGVLYGIILSVLGISGWACLLFKNFPIPDIYFKGFFFHLILAHLVYGLSIAVCFEFLFF
ncbi:MULTISPECIES: hypothetical protein [Zunongwangia]|jgi:hypothetical protein|nr:hypothetical protein [Zunongwangia profunda]MAS70047.1 hypothetical protein [Zunongwangia sp.]MCC4229006.1 hypothetical protein [Zunongwangia profunda]|tara:strand:- start:7082 stop:7531 length:450 start_codon:yes stop_codon:yes gene_type:complete